MIHLRRAIWLFSGICLPTLCGLCGCGTSQYETLLAKEIKAIRSGAPWARFWDYTTVPGVPVKVRIPEMFKTSYQLNSPHEQDDGPINAARAQPPFLNLPGFRLVFEDFYDEGIASRAPYYCYLAAQKSTPQQAQALAADLLAKLTAKFPNMNPPPKWEDVDCKTPEGGTLAWKKLTIFGDQFFDIDAGAAGGIQNRSMPATFELWLYEGQGYCVLIGWRINTEWDKKVGLLKMAPLAAGTVQIIEAAAAAPAP